MAQYIDKSTIVAEIESKIEKYTKRGEESDAKRDGCGMYWGGVLSCLNEVRTLCDTLEVKEVKDLALTWEDIRDICRMWIESKTPFGITGEALSKEVLKRFNRQKGVNI